MQTPYYYYGNYLKPYLRQEPQKTYTIAGMSLLTLIIFGSLAIAPTVETIVKTSKEVQNLKEASEKLSGKISDLEKARISFAHAAPYRDQVEQSLHPFAGWGEEVEKINQAALKNNVQIIDIAPQSELGLKLSFAGNYENVKMYLEDLQNQNPSFSITSLSIARSSNDKGQKIAESEIVSCEAEFEVAFWEKN